MKRIEKKVPREHANKVAAAFCSALNLGSHRYMIVGSIRRKEKMIRDIDIVTTCSMNKLHSEVMGSGAAWIDGGEKKANLMFQEMPINVYHAKPEYWGAMIFFLTGPQRYEIWYRRKAKEKGMLLNQYGLWKGDELIAARTEDDIYHALGKEWKAPELRGK